jgi:hypothetical protein
MSVRLNHEAFETTNRERERYINSFKDIVFDSSHA